jgi:ABC-2 type transport system ATP-binding protein
MEVSSTKALACVLDRMEIEYKILSDTTANVFTKVKASLLVSELGKENCDVISIQERTESLESFYISLVGGEKHDETFKG